MLTLFYKNAVMILILLFLTSRQSVWAQDSHQDKAHQLIEQYVESAVINTLLKKVGEAYEHTIKTQKLQIFPQASYDAVQQTVLFALKADNLRPMIINAYQQAKDKAITMYDQGQNQQQIEEEITSLAKEALDPVVKDKYFQHIANEMLKKAMAQTRALVTSVAVGQYKKKAAVQEQIVRQAIIEQYKKIVEYAVKEQIKYAVESQVKQKVNEQMQYEINKQKNLQQKELEQLYLQEQKRMQQEQQLWLKQQGYK